MTRKADKAERVTRLVDLLGLHPQTKAIGIAAKEFGVTRAQIYRAYMGPARAAVVEDVGQTRSQMIKQHHHRLTSIYHTAESARDKLAALSQLASLYGLDAPSHVAVTVDVLYNPEEQLRVMRDPRMLERVLELDAEFERARLGHNGGGS